ncbi:MAG: hypothetical protein Q9200_005320 [Gallowayella weberi]
MARGTGTRKMGLPLTGARLDFPCFSRHSSRPIRPWLLNAGRSYSPTERGEVGGGKEGNGVSMSWPMADASLAYLHHAFENPVKTEGDAALEHIGSYAGSIPFMADSHLRPDGFALMDQMLMPIASSKYSHFNGNLDVPPPLSSGMPPPSPSLGNQSAVSPSTRKDYTNPASVDQRYGYEAHPVPRYPTNPSSSSVLSASTSFESGYRSMPTSGSLPAYGPSNVSQNETSPMLPSQTPASGAPPFQPTKFASSIHAANGSPVQVDISAKIDKGFFKTDSDWTCYRRNYFSVACYYTLKPTHNAKMEPLCLRRSRSDANPVTVRSFAIGISARVDGEDGKLIELVQHTPKRDKGPTSQPDKVKLLPHTGPFSIYPEHVGGLSPRSGPSSDYETAYAPTSPSNQQSQTVATFDRIQFKNATANNGKRRAAQQYFHIVVELFAEAPNNQSAEGQWIKVASRISAPMVVRGRSPGHYADDRRGSSTSMGGPGGGSSGDSAGSQRDPHSGSSGIGQSGVAGMFSNPPRLSGSGGNGNYKGHQTASERVQADSVSDRSSTSSEYETVEMVGYERSDEHILTPEEEDNIENHEGYQYYPSTLMEAPAISNMPRPLFPPKSQHPFRSGATGIPGQRESLYGGPTPPSGHQPLNQLAAKQQ